MASIEPRPKEAPTAWRVFWNMNGRAGGRQSITFHDPELAEEAKELADAHRHKITKDEVAAILVARHNQGAAPDDVPRSELPDFRTVVENLWWPSVKPNLSVSTRKSYRGDIEKHFYPTFGHVPVDLIKDERCLAWLAFQDGNWAKSTVQNRFRLLKQILKWIARRYDFRNPMDDIKTPQRDTPEQTFLSPTEAAIAVGHTKDRLRDAVTITVHSGLRMGELLALTVDDIEFGPKGATITVSKTLRYDGTVGPPKTKASNRRVAVGAAATAALARRCAGKLGHEFLFQSRGGRPLSQSTLRVMWQKALRSAQRCATHPPALEFDRIGRAFTPANAVSSCRCATRLNKRPRWHDLRHTHAAWVIDAGWAADEVQKRLGHSKVEVTYANYWHRFPKNDHDRIAALDEHVADSVDANVAHALAV